MLVWLVFQDALSWSVCLKFDVFVYSVFSIYLKDLTFGLRIVEKKAQFLKPSVLSFHFFKEMIRSLKKRRTSGIFYGKIEKKKEQSLGGWASGRGGRAHWNLRPRQSQTFVVNIVILNGDVWRMLYSFLSKNKKNNSIGHCVFRWLKTIVQSIFCSLSKIFRKLLTSWKNRKINFQKGKLQAEKLHSFQNFRAVFAKSLI